VQAQSLRLQDLEPHTLLVREQGSGTRKACEEFFKDKRVHFTQTLEVASTDSQRECVVAGLGIALLTRHAVNLELATGLLKELPVEELPLYRSWCIVQAKAKRQSPVALAFQAFIRGERAQISALVERFSGSCRRYLPHRDVLQLGVVGQRAQQFAAVAVAFDRAAELHAALVLFLLLASLGVGLVRTVVFTCHCLSPR
jgi:hypothetical protein